MKLRNIFMLVIHVCFIANLSAASGSAITPDEALQKLLQGNKRFVNNKMEHCDSQTIKREATAPGQMPFAIVLACADSRVSPEIVFDQGIGDVFTVRVAGNVNGATEVDSIDYAVTTFNSPLLIVMGHENCGAVDAVLNKKAQSVPTVAALIEPAVKPFQSQPENNLANATKANIKNVVANLKRTPIVANAIKANKLKVVGAFYHFQTGEVDVITD